MPLCYHCGAPAEEEAEFCPQCGTRLASPNRSLDLLKIFGGCGLILSALVMGAGGACFFLFSSLSYPSGTGSTQPGMIATGAGLMAVAVLFFFGFCKLVRSSRERPIWLTVLTGLGMVLPTLGSLTIFAGIINILPISGMSQSGRGPDASIIMILAAVVGASVLLILAANKFFKKK